MKINGDTFDIKSVGTYKVKPKAQRLEARERLRRRHGAEVYDEFLRELQDKGGFMEDSEF